MKVVRLMLTKDKIVDIRENSIDAEVLAILLSDRSTGSNILWCTDDYSSLGEGYEFYDPIEVSRISGKNDGVIKPRIEKDKAAQELRSREKAEVFTPSWVCNVQNNLVDDAWFGISRRRFNTEKQEGWKTNYYPISFAETKGKTWNDYVRATRMEVSCGEAPYLTTRYDAVTGKYIPVRCRVGLLDRKLRVILENVSNAELVDKYKVLAPKAWGTGNEANDWLNPFIVGPHSVCTETYLVMGAFDTEEEAKNLVSYIQTKFFHAMTSILKISQNAAKGVYELVPMQDFSKSWSDDKLYEKYNLTAEEVSLIEATIKPNTNSNA